MQPLTLPEQREIEQILIILRRGNPAIIEIANHNRDMWLKALEIALQANTALSESWKKGWKPLSYDERFKL